MTQTNQNEVWICERCGGRFDEYINGCPHCSQKGYHAQVRQMNGDENLATIDLTPDLFMAFAAECGWEQRSAELLIAPDSFGRSHYPPPFAMGEQSRRCIVRIIKG